MAALRGAATLKARALKEVWNIAAVIPVENNKNGGNGSNGSSNGSFSGELLPEENFLGICSRELLARGCELLKRTRKGKHNTRPGLGIIKQGHFDIMFAVVVNIAGDLHWKIVSVAINRMNQVPIPDCSIIVDRVFSSIMFNYWGINFALYHVMNVKVKVRKGG